MKEVNLKQMLQPVLKEYGRTVVAIPWSAGEYGKSISEGYSVVAKMWLLNNKDSYICRIRNPAGNMVFLFADKYQLRLNGLIREKFLNMAKEMNVKEFITASCNIF